MAVLKLKPDFVEGHFALGVAYFNKGMKEESKRELETALKINPDHQRARKVLEQTRAR
jgi:Tfp pilus assembly protein PilF